MNSAEPKRYFIRHTPTPIDLGCNWNSTPWSIADTLEIDQFRPESSDHRPRTYLRLVYGAEGLHGIFSVEDRYVRSVRAAYHSEIWKDSCVELFLQPKPGSEYGYFNCEMNSGGAHLCSYITDPTRTPEGFKEFVKIPEALGRTVRVRSSLPAMVDPEIPTPIDWELAFFIPFSLLERYVGSLGNLSGQEWRGNAYKCAEEISHPHWAAWSPVDEFNFHLPRCFGQMVFG